MEKAIKNRLHPFSSIYRKGMLLKGFLLSMLVFCSVVSFAQGNRTITGQVIDKTNNPVMGATVVVKGNTATGTITDENGQFSLSVAAEAKAVVVSFIGMLPQEVSIAGKTSIKVILKDDVKMIDDVVVVGYAKQKKQSVVGAISQTKGEILERSGGISNIGAALTGNIPGLITVQGDGTPGDEKIEIFIRGQGTWNNSQPLILIDGIERSMNGLDMRSVESISVLKDASSTAVFGVKGANGVILITTKRGRQGKANINVTANTTIKVPSRLPAKYDSYDALDIRNDVIERELSAFDASWANYTPVAELSKYRNPANLEEAERYPNVDWIDETVNKYAVSKGANINVSGGTNFVKYYASVDYLNEGDIMKTFDNNKGYDPGYGYNRINIRSNLDFQLTKSTVFSMNLAGLHGDRKNTWSGFEYTMWQSAYSMAPDVMLPQYSDGSWGYYPLDEVGTTNSAANLGNNGIRHTKTTQFNTDFILTQDFSRVVKGLNFKGTFSFDNTFVSEGGLRDGGNSLTKWISPDGEVYYKYVKSVNQFDYVENPWTTTTEGMQDHLTARKMFYQAQLNYGREFGNHGVTAMGLFSRDQYATGSEFPHYREDWVFRTTYAYATRYFLEFNGAYNGSEKFSNDYRYDFFPSAAVGWLISSEPFMANLTWLDALKVRMSYGRVGSDNVNGRWLYQTQWAYSGQQAHLGTSGNDSSPYKWYKEASIGNPDIHWETVTKKNLGIEFSLLKDKLSGSVDVFNDYRTDILLSGGSRSVPVYFGGTPPTSNLGEVKVKGYELELKGNHKFGNGIKVWANVAMSHSVDEILEHEDPELLPEYQKAEGFQIGQNRSHLGAGYNNTWDEIYGSTKWMQYDSEKLPGDFNIIDFNGDGIINDYDSAPVGYPQRPQNTYNASLGIEYKGFTAFAQFYGVNNVSRSLTQTSFTRGTFNNVYQQGSYWTKDDMEADGTMPRWKTHIYSYGDFFLYDASYIRLKNVELAYTLTTPGLKQAGLQSIRFFANGNNLFLWTKMPDDREANTGGNASAYPMVRRYNMGINLVF